VICPTPCPLQESRLGSLEPGLAAAVVIHNLCRKLCQSSPTLHNPDRISISQIRSKKSVPSPVMDSWSCKFQQLLVRRFEAQPHRNVGFEHRDTEGSETGNSRELPTPISLPLRRCDKFTASLVRAFVGDRRRINLAFVSRPLGRWAPRPPRSWGY
jgi:hypothetical protein